MARPAEMLSEELATTSSSSRIKRLRVLVVTPADFQRVGLASTLRKTAERERIADAYSRATNIGLTVIVYVPPGTERARLDGVAGGSVEVQVRLHHYTHMARLNSPDEGRFRHIRCYDHCLHFDRSGGRKICYSCRKTGIGIELRQYGRNPPPKKATEVSTIR
jgi:hypothetical protein